MDELGMTYQEMAGTAERIKTLTTAVRNLGEELCEVSEELIKRGIQAEFALILQQNLERFHSEDMQEGFDEMLVQADKLEVASADTQAYETEAQ